MQMLNILYDSFSLVFHMNVDINTCILFVNMESIMFDLYLFCTNNIVNNSMLEVAIKWHG